MFSGKQFVSPYNTDKQQISVDLGPISKILNSAVSERIQNSAFSSLKKEKIPVCRIFTAGSGTNIVQAMTMDGDNDGVITKWVPYLTYLTDGGLSVNCVIKIKIMA